MDKRRPFVLEEASALAIEYGHLGGEAHISNTGDFEVIEAVAIVPYDKTYRFLFFKLYHETNDMEKAMAFYELPAFDVFLIFKELIPLGEPKYRYMDIRTYLEEIGTPLNKSIFASYDLDVCCCGENA
jgi:hypothetical protein